MHRLRTLSLFAIVLSGGCASANPDAGSGEALGTSRQAVDIAAVDAHQIAIANDNSVPVHATGAVFIPMLKSDGTQQTVASSTYGQLPVRGSCGVTFVSPHYAITSSHCFSDSNVPSPQTQTFGVWSYDVTNANIDSFYLDSFMEGTFPNYAPIFGQIVNQVPGYNATGVTCAIASRCAVNAGVDSASSYNCSGINAPDVTMLYCSNRSSYAEWLPIANDPATNGAVYMYWFHELFAPQSGNADMVTHYTQDSLGFTQNWHYLGAPSNILLPFMSVPWGYPSGPEMQRCRYGAGGDNDVRTDLYGCHGTSGSGVLEMDSSGNYSLLGPVHAGGWAWAGSDLCDDPNALTPGANYDGSHGLTYNSNVSVNNLVNALYSGTLTFDRYRIIRR